MKKLFTYLVLAFPVILTSCQKKGCTDPIALNFEQKADKDDGSCAYIMGCTDATADNYNDKATKNDGSCTYGTKGYIRVNIKPVYNGNSLVLNNLYTDSKNYTFHTSMFKSYLCNFKAKNSAEILFKDVILFDLENPSSLTFLSPLDPGSYQSFLFTLGLNDSLNSIDPVTVSNDHPLSNLTHNMWWTWATKYIFYKIEGKYDGNADNTPESNFVYHVGGSQYAKPIEINKAFTVNKGDTTIFELQVDLYKILTGTSDTLYFPNDHSTHTMDNMPLAERVNNLFAKAFSSN